MDLKKILVLLTALIIYVNYENYFKVDTQKLYREIANLKVNIEREKDLQKTKNTKESLLIDYDKITFDGKKYNYSQAMGAMQNQINSAAKDICNIKRIKWAQVATSKGWYDKLRMNIALSCKPKELFMFTNRLKSNKVLYSVENFRVSKDRRKEILNIAIQLVAFRRENESK